MANIMHGTLPSSSPSAPPAQTAPAAQGDHERLFRLLEEEGPAPEAFMLGLCDPWLEVENIFEGWEEDEDQA